MKITAVMFGALLAASAYLFWTYVDVDVVTNGIFLRFV